VIAVATAAVAGSFLALPIPLLPLQILYLNVVTDVFPALALSMGKGEPDLMKQAPRPRHEAVLTRAHWQAVGGWSLLLAICVLGSLTVAFHLLAFDTDRAVTISFLTLAFGKLWFVNNLRSPGSGRLDNEITRNPYLLASIALCVGLLAAAVYLPGISDLLDTVPPGPIGWLVIGGVSLVPFLVGLVFRRHANGSVDGALKQQDQNGSEGKG
jgi:Ca2+-transporting ATPase